MPVYALAQHIPVIDPSVYIAPGASVIGRVSIGARSSLWFNGVLRGDADTVTVGEDTNIQDLSTGHVDPGKPLVIGNRVTVGHQCVVHGCTIGDDCMVGMGAVVLSGADIGRGCIIGAGAVVLEGVLIPPFSLVIGSPGKVKKTYGEEILEVIRESSSVYVKRSELYRDRLSGLSV